MRKLTKQNRLKVQAYLNRTNFCHRVIPFVREAATASEKLCSEYQLGTPSIHIVSENAESHAQNTKSNIWSDSITLSFGRKYLPFRPTVQLKGNDSSLSETRASLVFSQTVSGDIFALIYPPHSEVLSDASSHFIVKHYNRSEMITVKSIMKLIQLTLEVNTFTCTEVYPNLKGVRLMNKLTSKDSAITSGGSAVWVYIRYLANLLKGLGKMHGVGTPGS